jgi:hypothetical protein
MPLLAGAIKVGERPLPQGFFSPSTSSNPLLIPSSDIDSPKSSNAVLLISVYKKTIGKFNVGIIPNSRIN